MVTEVVVMSGEEFKRYYADERAWPDGSYHDDSVITVDGNVTESLDAEAVEDGSVVRIESGMVFMPDGSDADLVEHAQQWKARQDGTYGTFYAPKDRLGAVIAAIESAGGKFIAG